MMIEEAKLHCAREHFKAISGDNVVYDIVDSYTSLIFENDYVSFNDLQVVDLYGEYITAAPPVDRIAKAVYDNDS